jgi:hypothetical protein
VGREVLEQERHPVPDVRRVDEVVVVENQVDVVRHGAELVEHGGKDGLDRRLRGLQQREHACPDAGYHPLQGVDHVGPERGRWAVVLVE